MSEPNTVDVERRLREKSGGIVLKPHCWSGRVGSGPKIWTRVQLWRTPSAARPIGQNLYGALPWIWQYLAACRI